jgi:4-carboxymuconolactone decarboxylase
MKIDREIYNRGLELLNTIHGGHAGEAIVEGLKDICPDYATATIQFGFGEVIHRGILDLKTREFAIIASCITLGTMPQLEAHIEAALNVGATQEEIIEIIFQTALYAGFALATNAMFAAKAVFEKFKQQRGK